MTQDTQAVQEPLTRDELADAIKTATFEVFATMLNIEIAAGDVFKGNPEPAPASGIVSLIGLAGAWVGTGSVACTAVFACDIASHLLMAEYTGINDDVLDAVAEVTNMIIGNVKTTLEERLGGMGLSTPTVIYGHNFQTRSSGAKEWTVVPFNCGAERMFVQICIAPNRGDNKTVRGGFPIPHILNI
jgi:chemotaxis protein CheX